MKNTNLNVTEVIEKSYLVLAWGLLTWGVTMAIRSLEAIFTVDPLNKYLDYAALILIVPSSLMLLACLFMKVIIEAKLGKKSSYGYRDKGYYEVVFQNSLKISWAVLLIGIGLLSFISDQVGLETDVVIYLVWSCLTLSPSLVFFYLIFSSKYVLNGSGV